MHKHSKICNICNILRQSKKLTTQDIINRIHIIDHVQNPIEFKDNEVEINTGSGNEMWQEGILDLVDDAFPETKSELSYSTWDHGIITTNFPENIYGKLDGKFSDFKLDKTFDAWHTKKIDHLNEINYDKDDD